MIDFLLECVSWGSLGLLRVPWDSLEFLGVPWGSLGFLGFFGFFWAHWTPWGSLGFLSHAGSGGLNGYSVLFKIVLSTHEFLKSIFIAFHSGLSRI